MTDEQFEGDRPDGDGPLTRVEATVVAVRDDIVDGVHPPGAKLGVEPMRQRYGVGSSTIREALTQLLPDGLVTSQGQRGFAVAPVSIDDLRDLSETRKLLEAAAIRDAIRLGDDDWEAGIVAALHRLAKVQAQLDAGDRDAAPEWEQRNRALHEAIGAACPSRWIKRMLDMMHHHSERYRRIALRDRGHGRDVHAEHVALVDAVLARDADLACDLASEHIQRTTDVIADLYDPTTAESSVA